MKAKPAVTVEGYLKALPPQAVKPVNTLRAIVKKALPEAEERISYGIITFTFHGNLIHVGGYAEHVSLYGGSQTLNEQADALAKYRTGKGTLKFELGTPLPLALITTMVKRVVAVRQEKVANSVSGRAARSTRAPRPSSRQPVRRPRRSTTRR